MPSRVPAEQSPSSTGPSGGNVPSRFSAPETTRVWNGWPPLGAGARGEGVKAVQSALTGLGFDAGGADGIMGPRSASALEAFQKREKLPVSGKIDRGTLAALDKALRGNTVASDDGTASAARANRLKNARFTGNEQLSRVFSGKVTLAPGSKGEGVKAVQKALSDMGFALHGGADGAFGGQSEKAVRNFQVHASRMYPDVKVTGQVDRATLQALDALAPKKGEKGQTRNVPSPVYDGVKVRVVVVKNEHRTYLFDKQGKLTDIFPNAVGARGHQTDNGLKVVRTRLDEQTTAKAGEQLWKDPTIFGPRLLDLSWADGTTSGEELHGTNAPARLGEDVSHGCVRHANKDIVKMFDALAVGDKVAIVDRIDDRRLGPVQR
jgi:L,D-transpeptidase YnhG